MANGSRLNKGWPQMKMTRRLKVPTGDICIVEGTLGRITCGNAILSGTLPEVEYEEITIK
jgi:hypothetical protein